MLGEAAGFLRSPSKSAKSLPISLATELNDPAAIAFCGPAFRRRIEIARGFSFGCNFHAQFAAGLGLAIQRLRHRCRATQDADLQNLHLKFRAFGLDVEQIAGVDFTRRLGRLMVGLDPP